MMDDDDRALFLDSDSDEERETILLTSIYAAVGYYLEEHYNKPRALFHVRDRLEWLQHVDELNREGGDKFKRLYRMNYASFTRLVEIIRPMVEVDKEMSYIRTSKGSILPEIMSHCLLRWLSGGEYLDIRLGAGISVPSFYRCIHKCMDAILAADELSFSFPSGEQIDTAAREFDAISSNRAIKGCVACVDGYLLRIQVPSATETGNVKAYFSGHYQTYGINVQAACDHRCRFVYVCIAAPGGANDITAFRKSSLSSTVQNLPLGKFIIGDNAYVCSEHLLTPFSGDEKKDPRKDAYNFYLSQLRIRIEQAFGLMTTKWRILRKPLLVKLENAGKVFMCISRLHNFCINEGYVVGNNDGDDEVIGWFIPSDIGVASVHGYSEMRQRMVNRVARKCLGRP
jgi:hypothetical protein